MKIFSIIALAAMGFLAGCQTCQDHGHDHGEAACCGACGGDAAPALLVLQPMATHLKQAAEQNKYGWQTYGWQKKYCNHFPKPGE